MVKKSFCLSGHNTSIKLEAEFWAALEIIASQKKISLKQLLEHADSNRQSKNLASHLRVIALDYYQGFMNIPNSDDFSRNCP